VSLSFVGGHFYYSLCAEEHKNAQEGCRSHPYMNLWGNLEEGERKSGRCELVPLVYRAAGSCGVHALKESASLREERLTSKKNRGSRRRDGNPGKSTYDRPVVREPDMHYLSFRHSVRQRNSKRDTGLPL
jgi:hypothetical protein